MHAEHTYSEVEAAFLPSLLLLISSHPRQSVNDYSLPSLAARLAELIFWSPSPNDFSCHNPGSYLYCLSSIRYERTIHHKT